MADVEPTASLQPALATIEDDNPSEVGASAWRSLVLRQARRMEDELDALPDESLVGENAKLAGGIRARIADARRLAEDTAGKLRTLRNWWTGNAIETAWDDLQTAREHLMLIEPSDRVRARLPAIRRRLAKVSADPAHDPYIAELHAIDTTEGDLTLEQRGLGASSAARLWRNSRGGSRRRLRVPLRNEAVA